MNWDSAIQISNMEKLLKSSKDNIWMAQNRPFLTKAIMCKMMICASCGDSENLSIPGLCVSCAKNNSK